MTPEALWFLDTLVQIRVSHRDSADRISVLEHRAPEGDSPPLHVHHTEDEVFHVLEGTLRLRVGHQDHTLGQGEALLAPKGVPHTYRVVSAGEARWLTVTTGRDFEEFVRAMSRPALRPELPPPGGPPTPEAAAVLAETALRYGIEIVGPPLG
ncbi:MAG: cupin domain-containing protein [Armatimonadota bacterium]|nr:cupin domain-containing protein [Armatimonadota bacterium]MDR7398612.1 cupin domain-containing protein [Armatimonadota bacterium]MDR7409833.1 cupin domain-containing protein [Armatimonadota bacterium]MDR7412361.1 cupin domain-containing protein [Armatimonadota bacterium]MDR7425811.1 cupin domain-containing protein [Armatimonadota bacterium]